MKPLIVALFLLISPALVYSQSFEEKVKLSIDALESALVKKDKSLINNYIAPDFSISTNNGPGTDNLFNTILKNRNFNSIKLIRQDKQIEKEFITLATVKFFMQNGQENESVIAFNPDAKIVFIDYFDRLFGQSRYRKSTLAGTIPFYTKQESIILKLKLNGQDRTLSFLLDTGANGMAIRKSLADSLKMSISHTQTANIVGGSAQVAISPGNTVSLTDSVTLRNQNIAIFEKVRDNIDGIIGLNLIKQYITKIDFDKKLITLYTFGDYIPEDKSKTIKIDISNNLIIMPGVLNLTGNREINGNFVMDTGAKYHLIVFSDFVRKNRLLLSGFKPESQGSTVSLGYATPVYMGHATEFSLGNDIAQYNMPVTLQASTKVVQSNQYSFAGSVGIDFLSRYNLTIDLLKKQVYLIPRKAD